LRVIKPVRNSRLCFSPACVNIVGTELCERFLFYGYSFGQFRATTDRNLFQTILDADIQSGARNSAPHLSVIVY